MSQQLKLFEPEAEANTLDALFLLRNGTNLVLSSVEDNHCSTYKI